MSIGIALSAIVLAAVAVWAVFAFRHKVEERPSEKSSHYESGLGRPGLPRSKR
jgi:hypothetical protein